MLIKNDPIIVSKQSMDDCAIIESNGYLIGYYLETDARKDICEDALLVKQDDNGLMLAICDGVGSSDRSYRAAKHVLTDISHLSTKSSAEKIQQELSSINTKLIGLEGSPETTFTMAVVNQDKYTCYQAGDSGLIHCGNRGRLKYKSNMHSPVGELVRTNELTERQALVHRDLNIVDNVMGNPEYYLDISKEQELAENDTLFITSDGLLDNFLTEDLISLVCNGDFAETMQKFTNMCKSKVNHVNNQPFIKPDDLSFVCLRLKNN